MFQINNNSVSATYSARRDIKQGLTLVEVLVAMTMTLIVLGVMTRAFSFASSEMQKGRAGLEMNNRLRSVQTLLRRDLASLTVDVVPHHALSTTPKGYFELVEGPRTDLNVVAITPGLKIH